MLIIFAPRHPLLFSILLSLYLVPCPLFVDLPSNIIPHHSCQLLMAIATATAPIVTEEKRSQIPLFPAQDVA
jgi:hypothetical protein